MRKLSVFILSIVYFVLSTGIIITIHYCHSHFSDFKLYGTYEDDCCESTCGFSNSCCTFETISGKITQEHVSSDYNQTITPKELYVDIFSFEPELEEERNTSLSFVITDFSPPQNIPIFNCSLIFYG